MKIEVLYIADCPHHQPAVKRVHEMLRAIGRTGVVEEIEIRSNADAEAWRFIGSPTVRVNGLDIEPEARAIRHFGVGCRSYAEAGHRSGLPSRDLIRRALEEDQVTDASRAVLPSTEPGVMERRGAESGVLVA
ncbi:MAG TPA: hypothetical protein VGE93_24160, partial [Bryobacteraceae bacterium]